ncbi:MAG: PEGA domain-containing protein [Epsilonproteobacteria bacterium]|nr:PEGA domain-containing protein [Campylobacterota bacterium]
MKKILLTATLGISMAFGSASIIKGTSQTITFESKPSGAMIEIDGQAKCETPCSVKLKKNKYDAVMVKKEGYKTKTLHLEKSFDGVALINIVWDLSTTDAITGAIFEYEPNKYFIELEAGNN